MSDSKQVEERLQKWERGEKVGGISPLVDLMGYEHKVLYTPLDVKDAYLDDIGFPGEYPFTRGVYPAMYRKALMRFPQYSGFGTAEDTNRRWKYLISHGQMTVNLAFDLPTHMGIDSDAPEAEDEVGRVGVAIDSLRDFEVLFDGIPLVPAFFNTVGPAAILLAMYIATGEKKGLPPSQVMGAFTNAHQALPAAHHRYDRILLPQHAPLLSPEHPGGLLPRRRFLTSPGSGLYLRRRLHLY